MRIGLIADVHGNPEALKQVMVALTDRVDVILFMGDLAGYYPFADECLDLWRENIISVRGNHDEVMLRSAKLGRVSDVSYSNKFGSALNRSMQLLSTERLSLIESWPKERYENLDGTAVYMCHGAPWDCLNARVYPDFPDWDRFCGIDAKVILLGHTHYPFTWKWKDKLIVNPGSVGQSRNLSGVACYAELDLATGDAILKSIPYDPEPLIQYARRHEPNIPYLAEVLYR